MLDSVSKGLEDSKFGKGEVREDFHRFCHCILNACVEGDREDHLRAALGWIGRTNENGGLVPTRAIAFNAEAMLRACAKDAFDLVHLLYDGGFEITCNLVDAPGNDHGGVGGIDDAAGADGGESPDPEDDVILQLSRLEALARPVYLLARHRTFSREDPVAEAFRLLGQVRGLKATMKAFQNKLERIESGLQAFTVGMLHLCQGRPQVELFLDRDDQIDGISRGSTVLRRIDQALQLGHKDFVTHDSCQQVVRHAFYDEGYSGVRNRSHARKALYGARQVLGTPAFAVAFLLARWKNRCCDPRPWSSDLRGSGDLGGGGGTHFYRQRDSSIVRDSSFVNVAMAAAAGDDRRPPPPPPSRFELCSQNLRVPLNRLISQTASLAVFIAWVILTQVNPSDSNGRWDPNYYDIFAALWAFGYISADIQVMRQMSSSLRAPPSSSAVVVANSISRVAKFFSNPFYDFRLASHVVFLSGLGLEAAGYGSEAYFPSRAFPESTCLVDDPSSYKGYHLVKVGIAAQGVGIVMILCGCVLHMFRLSPAVGAVYVAMRRCLGQVASFAATYVVITAAFGLGLHFIFKATSELCREERDDLGIAAVVCLGNRTSDEEAKLYGHALSP